MTVKPEDETFLVPDLEVKISKAWVNLVTYCQGRLPYGELHVEIANSQPGKIVKEVPSVRFDSATVPREGQVYLLESLGVRIPKPWIDMIQWIQEYFTCGTLGFKLISASPTELIQAKQKVNFSKPDTIPAGMPLEISKV